ncbi:hypothetical protein N7462_005860 [Penicillium macrosclerotiorum]|uniref:uncharacterized protein n=1 Tax=Penicillium macrosclerotiorum TaxID=303699 RepID=UPI0025474922|nr:uncharacterized protein N7462_005860 [Penicillium macrosclerotiorum]KAJ5682695.1 hypothetical protein N7462_005860 [Penicillium macrosclerotiorum]
MSPLPVPALFPFNSRMSRPFKPREIACARCFRLKRRCDHVKPTCGECRRKGAECLPARSRKSGDSITVPVAYLKELERRVAELEGSSPNTRNCAELCDAGVQTDPVPDEQPPIRIPSTAQSPNWRKNRAEEDNALMLLSESQQRQSHQIPRLSPFSQSSFTDTFLQLNDESLDFLRLDKGPTFPLIGNDSIWLTELYTNIYFSISYREWPFLNESAWKSWHREEVTSGQDEWRFFFLRIVYAIGASLCSTMHRDSTHLARSKELYASAMSYYPLVVGHPSMVLQVQASLLLIIYALHSPSSEEIATIVSSILPFCVTAITHLRKCTRTNSEDEMVSASGEVLTENMFIACYMLNEVIASGWDRPVSASYRIVDDDLCILGDTIQPPVNTNPALGHLFRLRKIQSNIRRSLERSRWQFSADKISFSSSFKSALDIWRQDIPRYGTSSVSSGYYHPNWMTKLYDYSILILMEEKRNFLDHEGTQEIFSAVVEVCMKFRRLQEEGHVMCFTWSALIFQFRACIMLLYLIWATRPLMDGPILLEQNGYECPEAIEACTQNLACFAERWDDAVPYFKLFGFLHSKVSHNIPTEAMEIDLPALAEAESHLEQLKKKYLHQALLGMIEDMMYGGFVQFETIADNFVTDII